MKSINNQHFYMSQYKLLRSSLAELGSKWWLTTLSILFGHSNLPCLPVNLRDTKSLDSSILSSHLSLSSQEYQNICWIPLINITIIGPTVLSSWYIVLCRADVTLCVIIIIIMTNITGWNSVTIGQLEPDHCTGQTLGQARLPTPD